MTRKEQADVVRAFRRYRWLGHLSVNDWQRFFNTEYVEVIFRGILADEVRASTQYQGIGEFSSVCLAVLYLYPTISKNVLIVVTDVTGVCEGDM